MKRVLIIGLDGATFDLIRPWCSEGHLPNLARLMREGAHGPLLSTLPPMTFPAWNAFMTGRNPGRHGIFDFTERVPGSYQIRFVNARQRRGPTLWRMLSEAGRRVGVVGVPCTWPPEPVNGVMISGFDAPRADRSAMHPPELYDELQREVGGYRITSNIIRDIDGGRPEAALRTILETAERKSATARYLYGREPWDCFMVLFGETDHVAHHFWRYMDPHSPLHEPASEETRNAIRTVYAALDRTVGELVDMAPSGTTVLVVSDHGFGGAGASVLHVNRYLEERGLLSFRNTLPRGLWLRALRDLKVRGMRVLPMWLRRRLRYTTHSGLASQMETALRFGSIDMSGTRAFSEETPYFPTVWVNLEGREPEGTVPRRGYEAVRDEVIAALQDWRNPHTGEAVVRRAYRREEVYQGERLEGAPDIIVDYALDRGYSYLSHPSAQSLNGHPVERIRPDDERFSRFLSTKSGSHRRDGILILHGEAVRGGTEVMGAELMDMAPTVLRLLGLRVPEEMDGKVLEEALDPRAAPARAATAS